MARPITVRAMGMPAHVRSSRRSRSADDDAAAVAAASTPPSLELAVASARPARVSAQDAQSPASVEMARRLLEHNASLGSGEAADRTGETLQTMCGHVCANLREAVGAGGCNALLARALARAETNHPTLKDVRRLKGNDVQLDGVVASVETHGIAAVTAAIEALLAAVLDILTRLIGEEMAMRVINRDALPSRTGGGARAP
jgi:hypothetical protein